MNSRQKFARNYLKQVAKDKRAANTTDKAEHAEVVRYGNTFYVLVNVSGSHVTEEFARENAVAAFSFAGPASKSNPLCVAAFREATTRVRELVH